MIHARPDYNRIQDPENKIPTDEPVCLFRGHDPCVPTLLRIYAILAWKAGCNSDVIHSINTHAEKIDQWQKDHPESVHPANL